MEMQHDVLQKYFLMNCTKIKVSIETIANSLQCTQSGTNICVNMGVPKLLWDQIPLSHEMDTVNIPIILHNQIIYGTAVNIGNPHVVFFTKHESPKKMAKKYGSDIEQYKLFPNHVNVNFAKINKNNEIELHVWERGVGLTQACGSGACATLVAAIQTKNIQNNYATISLSGGTLLVESKNDKIYMTGCATHVFNGNIDL